ncbi:deleted in malignant brain tumors 1 protein-like [Dreissena polymorpha]|uniref:deleted in malignant brain tumors 1 protein-like n=1 Tax=Dreissena polymorpha TaxID=45954 RepID=UPI0022650538|nr:deleted in malignant brain tumors 1 protein-like [Dreissena polymorpha]
MPTSPPDILTAPIPTLAPNASCGGRFYESGNLSSPNYPYNYTNSLTCTYYLQANAGLRVCLSFDVFRTESVYDVVSLYDGPNTNYILLGSYSGIRDTSLIICSSGSYLTMNFLSDNNINMTGFYAQFYSSNETYMSTTTPGNNASVGTCGGRYHESGRIASPNYPGSYFNYANCIYYITGPSNSKICLYFDFFDTESTFDYVQLYDGPTTTSRSVGSYSGINVTLATVCSSRSSMTVQFISDGSVTYQGFLASFFSVNNTIGNCSKGFFSCDNGRCQGILRLCDGVLDCNDGSDERGCDCTGDLVSCS